MGRIPDAMNDGTRGIVYIATGEEFVEEARISAESAKAVMPDIPITLFTDVDTSAGKVFDDTQNIEKPRHDFGDQVYHLDRTPYQRTIFLDSDIYLDASLEGLFDVLDEFDIAVAHNQRNYSSNRIDFEAVEAIPDCFPEYNSGVVAFEQNQTISDFFNSWQDAYAEVTDRGQVHNQAAFRLALYRSDVRIATIPSEYNCVFRRPGCVNGQVRAFHGRLVDIDSSGASKSTSVTQAVEELNSRIDLRSYYRLGNEVRLAEPNLLTRVRHSVRTRGVVGTAKRVPAYLQQRL